MSEKTPEISILDGFDLFSNQNNDNQVLDNNDPDKSIVIQEKNRVDKIAEDRKKSLRSYSRSNDNFVAQIISNDITCPSVKEALSGPNASEWKIEMDRELQSLIKCGTWVKVARPENKNIIGCKWVLRNKYNADGTISKRKARLVAKGYSQIPGIDYLETFAPVARLGTIRMIMSIAAKQNLELYQLDIVMAYINGDLNEEIYMEQPLGYEDSDDKNMVCLLKKSLYGLKQSGRQWYEKLKNHLISAGLIQSNYDKCLYYTQINGEIFFLIVYVDDIIIATNSQNMLGKIKSSLNSKFNMKDLGKLSYCLGIEFNRNDGFITMSQNRYIEDLLSKYQMNEANSVKTPLEPKIQLAKTCVDEKDDDKPEVSEYQSLIGSLMYLTVCTRPDLSYTVSTLSQFNQNPNTMHWKAAKRVLRYLIGTKHYALHFSNTAEGLHGYVDSDWGSNVNDRISQYGYIFKLGDSSIMWESRKQKCVALSSTEAEYIALCESVKEAIYLQNFLDEIGYFEPQKEVIIYCDNQGAQKLAKNSVFHARTKHIDIKYHFVRKIYEQGLIDVRYIPTTEMPADILTKSLPIPSHQRCLQGLGIKNLSNEETEDNIEIN